VAVKKSLLDKLGSIALSIGKSIFIPLQVFEKTQGLSEKNLRAFLEYDSVSKMLLYTAYDEIEEGVGVYTMADGRKGFIFRVGQLSYPGSGIEDILQSFFSQVNIPGLAVHINTFSGRNLDSLVKDMETLHACNVDVKRRDLLMELGKEQAAAMRSWARKSMLQGHEYRITNRVTTISVLLPYEYQEKVRLVSKHSQVSGALSDLHVTNLGAEHLISLLQEFLNPEQLSWQPFHDPRMRINKQIANANTRIRLGAEEIGGEAGDLRIGDNWCCRVMTTKQYPREIDLSTFHRVFFDWFPTSVAPPITTPFISSLVISYEDTKKRAEKVKAKAASDISNLNGVPAKMLKTKPNLRDRRKEAEEVIKAIDQEGQIPMAAMWTLALFDDDIMRLNETTSMMKSRFESSLWDITEEKFPSIALQSLLFSFPLQYLDVVKNHLERFTTLFKANDASLSPILTEYAGNGDPVIPFVGRGGQLQFFDLFSSPSNYNICVAGKSGGGKSYSMAWILANMLMSGCKIRGVDSGRSYQGFVNLVGGQYVDFTQRANLCLNFFSKIIPLHERNERDESIRDASGNVTPILDKDGESQIDADELTSIAKIVAVMTNLNIGEGSSNNPQGDLFRAVATAYIEDAIRTAWKRKKNNAGMEDVWRYLQERRNNEQEQGMDIALLQQLIIALAPYGEPGGKYYQYFNGAANINFESDLMVVELDRLEGKGGLTNVALMSLLQSFITEFFYDDWSRRKVFFVDEAWKVFRNSIVSSFLEDLYRRVRKYGGSGMVITQAVPDFFVNGATQALFANSAFKFYLPQENDTIDRAIKENMISLSGFDLEMIKSIKSRTPHYSEAYISSEAGKMVGRIKSFPFWHWLVSNSNRDQQVLKKIRDEYQCDRIEAAWIKAQMINDPETTKERLLESLEAWRSRRIDNGEKIEEEKEWDGVITAIDATGTEFDETDEDEERELESSERDKETLEERV
jgi:conjugal transfer ATP-binding protein TraC